jgi:hypothetical protein
LLDPKLDIQLKISSANTVMGVIKNIGDDFASLMTEIMQDFASIFAKDMTASEATDYSNLLKKLGEGDDQATSALLYSMATVAVLGFKVLHGFGVEI